MNINSIEITHENKMLFPDDNISKRDVANYYNQIATYILPLADIVLT